MQRTQLDPDFNNVKNIQKHIYDNQGNLNTTWISDDTDELLLPLRAIVALWLLFAETSLTSADIYANTYMLNYMIDGVFLQNNGVEIVSRAIMEVRFTLG